MSKKTKAISFNSLKISIRVIGYTLFGIIMVTAMINIIGIVMNGDNVIRKILEIIFQLIFYPCLCFLIRELFILKYMYRQPEIIRIAGTMMPLFIFIIGFVMCFNTGLAVFTLTPGYGYPEGFNGIYLPFSHSLACIRIDSYSWISIICMLEQNLYLQTIWKKSKFTKKILPIGSILTVNTAAG